MSLADALHRIRQRRLAHPEDVATNAEAAVLREMEARGDEGGLERLRTKLARRALSGGPPPRKQPKTKSFLLKVTDNLRIRLSFDPTSNPTIKHNVTPTPPRKSTTDIR